MSNETIFFSYSRDDTEFVLNLAKNLRLAGASIWLDQLDIFPGSRWDKSIEDALMNSKTLLVVLSKTSVESDNVLDEVSFALEEGKKVVPILLESCEIPFRLRRLQYADFTEHHKKGIQTLIQALCLNTEVASKLNDFAEQHEENVTIHKSVLESKKIKNEIEPKNSLVSKTQSNVENQTNQPILQKSFEKVETVPLILKNDGQKNAKTKIPKTILFGLLLLIIIGGAVWSAMFFKEDEDSKLFNDTLQRNTIQDFEYYISRFPEGKFIDAAHDSIYVKINRSKIKQERDAWEAASKANNLDGYQTYLIKFSTGNHAEEAKQKIEEFSANIENIAQDNDAWKIAVAQASVTAFLEYYINQAILGTHREEALQKAKEIGTHGWLYCGRFLGENMTEGIFDLIWRNSNYQPNNILHAGDIVILKAGESPRRVYRSANNRNSGNANSVLVDINKNIYISAVEKEGNALVVQIIY